MFNARYFDIDEFRCKHCGELPASGIDPRLVELLDAMREELCAPLIIGSGYRCQEHNTQCGGVENSQHLYGTAADIWTPRPDICVDALAWLARWKGAEGVGRYYDSEFVHVDMRGYIADWEG